MFIDRRRRRQYFSLVKDGEWQTLSVLIDRKPVAAFIVADSIEDIERLICYLDDSELIEGRLIGECLLNSFSKAVRRGAKACCCVSGWYDDGSPQLRYFQLDE